MPALTSLRLPPRWLTALALTLIAALALWLRLYKLGEQSFWYDETASAHFAGMAVTELWGADSHPPLFYLLLHPWLVWFGHDEYALRLLNVLLSMATLVPLFLLGRRIGGTWVGLAAAAIFAGASFPVEYAQELRMYALLALVAATSLYGFAELLHDPHRAARSLAARGAPRRAWLLVGLGTLLALYTHNTAFLLPMTTTLLAALLWWPRPERWRLLRNWTLVHGVVLALWALYWPQLLRQALEVSSWTWIEQPSFGEFLLTESRILFGIAAQSWLWPWALPAFLLLSLCGWRALPPLWRVVLLTAMVLPALVSLALGWLFRPIYLSRTLIWTELPAAVLVGAGLVALLSASAWPAGWRARTLGVVLVLVLPLANALSLRQLYDVWRNADFRSVAEMVVEHSASDDVVLLPGLDHLTLAYYLERAGANAGSGPPASVGGFRRNSFHLGMLLMRLPERERFFHLDVTWRSNPYHPVLLALRFPCHEVTGSWERQGMILRRYERQTGCIG